MVPTTNAMNREFKSTSPTPPGLFSPCLRATRTCVPVLKLEKKLVKAIVPKNPKPIAASWTWAFANLPTIAVEIIETIIWDDCPAIAGPAICRMC